VISPSRGHPNRKAHNWLVYYALDRDLVANRDFLKGCLYDLGAGESPYREFFLQFADRYVAVDWSASLHGVRADILADLNEPLPIGEAVADTVVALSVLEHLREPRKMLSEVYRIMRPGGTLVLQVPWQWWIHEAPYDFFRYTPYGLGYLLSGSGFSEIKIKAQLGFFSMLALKLNYFSLRLIRGPKTLRLLTRAVLQIPWYLGQQIGPWLDRFDGNWARETTGYFVVARKQGTIDNSVLGSPAILNEERERMSVLDSH